MKQIAAGLDTARWQNVHMLYHLCKYTHKHHTPTPLILYTLIHLLPVLSLSGRQTGRQGGVCLTAQTMSVHIRHTSSTHKSLSCSFRLAHMIRHISFSPNPPPILCHTYQTHFSLLSTSLLNESRWLRRGSGERKNRRNKKDTAGHNTGGGGARRSGWFGDTHSTVWLAHEVVSPVVLGRHTVDEKKHKNRHLRPCSEPNW